MAIVVEGLGDTALRRLIRKKLDALRDHLRQPPTAVRVGFTDENGPKGGPSIRCALTIDMARRRAVHVEHTATTPRRAFDLAFDALERRALQEIDRTRDRRWADRDDLDWIERQSGTLIECAVFEDANGAVLFACGSASLRELLPLRVPFD